MEAGLTGKAAECLEARELEVIGTVPEWLEGVLYRNGPGQFDVELQSGGTFVIPHWFDGLTQLHAYQFKGGRVTHRSRHLYPALEEHIAHYGVSTGFAGPQPARGVLGTLWRRTLQALRLAPPDVPSDPATGRPLVNVGVTIGPVAGRLYSKTDANALVEVHPKSLAPGPPSSYADLNPAFRGPLSGAHGQRDEAAATYYAYTLDFTARGCGLYRLFAVPDGEPRGRLLASITADPAFIHSFAMTQNYLVLAVWPLLLSPAKLALARAPLPAMAWQPQRGTLLYVVDRRGGGGHVATYRSEAFYAFHHINAFEAGGALHLDLAAYVDGGAAWLDAFRLPHMRSGRSAPLRVELRRYTLPDLAGALVAGPGVARPVPPHAVLAGADTPGGCWMMELPRINKAAAMRPDYRFVYCAAAVSRDSPFFDAVAKVDVGSGVTRLWRAPGHYTGEPLFVARPGGEAEDDGLLLVVVLAGGERASYLLLLDARDMAEVARAPLGHAVAFGFHGNLVAPDGTSTDLS